MRIWGKLFKDSRMLADYTVELNNNQSRTEKVFQALDEMCYEFDLSKPIWLENTISEFRRHDKCRFTSDNFVDTIEFDYFEFHVIEE